MRNICFIVIVLCLHACQHKGPPSLLDQALELAGENRNELEKVLSFYSRDAKDSLKYRAACFLIENMGHYYYYEGEQLENYKNYYKALYNHKNRGSSPTKILDSVSTHYGTFTLKNLRLKHDLRELDADYLCDNIEWSFKVWEEQPWGKNVSFEDFCEYILPYRIGNEKPTEWKQSFYERFNRFLAVLEDSTYSGRDDPVVAVKILMDSINANGNTFFTTIAPPNYPHVGAETSLYLTGSCRELTDFAIYACRALGIPCHIDFLMVRGNHNAEHFWVSYTDKSGELYIQDFPKSLKIARQDPIRFTRKAKMYRHTFSLDHDTRNTILALDGSAPPPFDLPLFKDITIFGAGHYIQEMRIPASQLYNTKPKGKVAYLCLSRRMEWVPVAWARFDKNNLFFRNVQKGDVMRVATWENDRLVFQTDPFSMHHLSNEITFFAGTDSVHDVVLLAKHSLGGENLYRNRMIGGVVEASDYPDFRDSDTLYVVNEVPKRLYTSVNVRSKKAYKYLRYYGADGNHCNIAELAFYENAGDREPVKGKVIGTPGDWRAYGTHEYTNVFDGSTLTSFNYKEGSGGWAGLELEEPVKVSRVVYSPRNRDNYIRPGDTFELFYCDREWKSLGKIKDEHSDSLLYRDVPYGALLYLRNHNRGVDERIFTFEEGEQKWK